jgi:diadenosine tetraphosphate (Ap4A) HIT family hydrolase
VRRVDRAEAMALLEREAEALPSRFDRLGTRRAHLLVILRRHVESIGSMPWSEYAEVQRLCWEAARAIERALQPKRVFIAALGSARQLTMSFPHHHVHVVPLFDGGVTDRPAEVLTWRHGVLLYTPEEARELGAMLRGAWEDGGADLREGATGSHPAPSSG